MKRGEFLLSFVVALGFVGSSGATTRFVWTNSPTPTPPYTNWARAAHVIQAAIDISTNGDLILVTNGAYDVGGATGPLTTTNRAALTIPITVQSVNGPAVTMIAGQGTLGSNDAVRCAYVADGAVLSGFTLTNGVTGSGAAAYGGGVWCETNGVVSNCVIAGNATPGVGSGGGAYQGTLNNCSLIGNSSSVGGGASSATLIGCTLSDNTTANGILGYGGGAYDAMLSNCVISGNAALKGGGTYEGTLNFCVISNNTAGYGLGGGSYLATLNNCTLIGNSAQYGGGDYLGDLYNCVVARNTADVSGGGGSHSAFNNCTIVGNSAKTAGGGADLSFMYNCIVYYNTAPAGPNYVYNYEPSQSCTAPNSGSPESGNITNEPLIASINNPHLLAGSPCIDAGITNLVTYADIDGETRVQGANIDMGSDEFTQPLTGALAVQIYAMWTNIATGFAAPFESVVQGKPSQLTWSWGDGGSATDLCLVSHAYTTPGIYAVVLVISNDSGSASATVDVQVVAQPAYYAAPGGGHVAPFTNWVTAATNIQDAIAAGTLPGRMVWVSNGTYAAGGVSVQGSISNGVALTNAVKVESVNGPLVTLIKGNGPLGATAIRCAYVASHCCLSGFTLTNGYTRTVGDSYSQESGGGAWSEPDSVVSNCIVTGNSAYGNGGGAYACRLLNCALIANSAEVNGGGAYGGELSACSLSRNAAAVGAGAHSAFLEGCTASSNTAHDGGGVANSTAFNCLFSHNAAQFGGGAAYASLINCVLTGNSATNDAFTGGFGGGTYEGRQVNCTLSGNIASANGGGSALASPSYNCIVYYNTCTGAPDHFLSSVLYGCSATNIAGTGIITNQPGFVDTNDWSDLRLAPASACINAGTNSYVVNPADFDGRPRIIGGRVDLGAYESTNGVTTNGVAWGWLADNGLESDGTSDLLDPDGDGMNNRDEYVADTQPTNGASLLAVTQLANAATARVWFASSSNRVYTLQSTTNLLSGAWTNVPGQVDIPGPGGASSLADTNPAAAVSFRVSVDLP